MKLPTTLLLGAFSFQLFIYCCWAACTFTASDGSVYDLSSLTMGVGSSYYSYVSGGTNYTFNVCGELTGNLIGTGAPYCLVGSSICQGEAGSYYSVGMSTNTSFQDSPFGAANGVTMLYGSGAPCKSAIRQAMLNFQCEPTQNGLLVTNYSQPSTCHYAFTILSRAACPTSTTGTTGAPTTDAATTDATATTDAATTAATTDAATTDATTTDAATTDAATTDAATTDAATTDASTTDAATTDAATTGAATTDATTGDTSNSATTSDQTSITTTSDATSGTNSTGDATTGGGPTNGGSTSEQPTTTTGHSEDTPIHDTPGGKALIGIVVGLGVFVIIAGVLLVREYTKRRRAQNDSEMERLRLTGSTYSDVKKRYLK